MFHARLCFFTNDPDVYKRQVQLQLQPAQVEFIADHAGGQAFGQCRRAVLDRLQVDGFSGGENCAD